MAAPQCEIDTRGLPEANLLGEPVAAAKNFPPSLPCSCLPLSLTSPRPSPVVLSFLLVGKAYPLVIFLVYCKPVCRPVVLAIPLAIAFFFCNFFSSLSSEASFAIRHLQGKVGAVGRPKHPTSVRSLANPNSSRPLSLSFWPSLKPAVKSSASPAHQPDLEQTLQSGLADLAIESRGRERGRENLLNDDRSRLRHPRDAVIYTVRTSRERHRKGEGRREAPAYFSSGRHCFPCLSPKRRLAAPDNEPAVS